MCTSTEQWCPHVFGKSRDYLTQHLLRARKPRKAREKGKQGGAFTEGRNWLISYLPAECANPGLKISMGKTIHWPVLLRALSYSKEIFTYPTNYLTTHLPRESKALPPLRVNDFISLSHPQPQPQLILVQRRIFQQQLLFHWVIRGDITHRYNLESVPQQYIFGS